MNEKDWKLAENRYLMQALSERRRASRFDHERNDSNALVFGR
jgi:hypothetical protein